MLRKCALILLLCGTICSFMKAADNFAVTVRREGTTLLLGSPNVTFEIFPDYIEKSDLSDSAIKSTKRIEVAALYPNQQNLLRLVKENFEIVQPSLSKSLGQIVYTKELPKDETSADYQEKKAKNSILNYGKSLFYSLNQIKSFRLSYKVLKTPQSIYFTLYNPPVLSIGGKQVTQPTLIVTNNITSFSILYADEGDKNFDDDFSGVTLSNNTDFTTLFNNVINNVINVDSEQEEISNDDLLSPDKQKMENAQKVYTLFKNGLVLWADLLNKSVVLEGKELRYTDLNHLLLHIDLLKKEANLKRQQQAAPQKLSWFNWRTPNWMTSIKTWVSNQKEKLIFAGVGLGLLGASWLAKNPQYMPKMPNVPSNLTQNWSQGWWSKTGISTSQKPTVPVNPIPQVPK